ncbi:MAG: J domain-containing protein, partial [Candidatus Hydrothermarchaeales archaeon]
PQKMGFHKPIHTPSQVAITIVIPLIGAFMFVSIIGFVISYAGYYLSSYYLGSMGFLIFLPLYLYFYDLYEDSMFDPREFVEDESKNDVIIDTLERKLIIHDTHVKEDFAIAFEDITDFEVRIDVSVDEGVKTTWAAWVYDQEESHLLGVSDWKEDLEDLIEKIKSFLEVETPDEEAINLYGESYEVLGVDPGASVMEIKKAYRELAKRYHPDIGGDDETFKRINEAYQSLIEVR